MSEASENNPFEAPAVVKSLNTDESKVEAYESLRRRHRVRERNVKASGVMLATQGVLGLCVSLFMSLKISPSLWQSGAWLKSFLIILVSSFFVLSGVYVYRLHNVGRILGTILIFIWFVRLVQTLPNSGHQYFPMFACMLGLPILVSVPLWVRGSSNVFLFSYRSDVVPSTKHVKTGFSVMYILVGGYIVVLVLLGVFLSGGF